MPLRHSFDRQVLEEKFSHRGSLGRWARAAQDSERGVWRRFDAALCRALLEAEDRRRPSTKTDKPASWEPFAPLLASSPVFREDAFAVKPDAVGSLEAHKAVKRFCWKDLRIPTRQNSSAR